MAPSPWPPRELSTLPDCNHYSKKCPKAHGSWLRIPATTTPISTASARDCASLAKRNARLFCCCPNFATSNSSHSPRFNSSQSQSEYSCHRFVTNWGESSPSANLRAHPIRPTQRHLTKTGLERPNAYRHHLLSHLRRLWRGGH